MGNCSFGYNISLKKKNKANDDVAGAGMSMRLISLIIPIPNVQESIVSLFHVFIENGDHLVILNPLLLLLMSRSKTPNKRSK
jgi:hypothetical protein